MTTFVMLYQRSRRRAKALRFHVAHIENRASWAPFSEIEDLGSKVPGALLFGRKAGLSDHTLKPEHPTLGS